MKLVALNPEIKKPKVWVKQAKEDHLWLHIPTGVYYVRDKLKGKKPLFKTTKHKTIGKARVAAKAIHERWNGATAAEFQSEGLTFGEHAPRALEDWLASSKFRKGYKGNMVFYVNQLTKEIGYARLNDINEGFIETWIEDFKKRSKRTTYKDYVLYIRKVMSHAKRNGLIKTIPNYENPDPPTPGGRVYTLAEMVRMFDTAESRVAQAKLGKNIQRKYRALCTLVQLRCCFNGFLRLREALCAPWSEIDLEAGRWVIPPERIKMGSRTGKGKDIFVDDELILPLLRELRELQREFFGFQPEWLFPNPIDPGRPSWDNKSAWKSLLRAAKVDLRDAEWHSLRDTALTWALCGDDEFQDRLKSAPPEEQKAMRATLENPLLVSEYAGTNMRTIQKNYIRVGASHTQGVASALRFRFKK